MPHPGWKTASTRDCRLALSPAGPVWSAACLPRSPRTYLVSPRQLHDYFCRLRLCDPHRQRVKLYGECTRSSGDRFRARRAGSPRCARSSSAASLGVSKYGIAGPSGPAGSAHRQVSAQATHGPLHIFGLIGLPAAASNFSSPSISRSQTRLQRAHLRPADSLLAILLIMIGFQFITMGLLGEMLSPLS